MNLFWQERQRQLEVNISSKHVCLDRTECICKRSLQRNKGLGSCFYLLYMQHQINTQIKELITKVLITRLQGGHSGLGQQLYSATFSNFMGHAHGPRPSQSLLPNQGMFIQSEESLRSRRVSCTVIMNETIQDLHIIVQIIKKLNQPFCMFLQNTCSCCFKTSLT